MATAMTCAGGRIARGRIGGRDASSHMTRAGKQPASVGHPIILLTLVVKGPRRTGPQMMFVVV
jgi:hypothetical protein